MKQALAVQVETELGKSFPARQQPLKTMECSRYGSNMSWRDATALAEEKRIDR